VLTAPALPLPSTAPARLIQPIASIAPVGLAEPAARPTGWRR
jgi:hypothetical protein